MTLQPGEVFYHGTSVPIPAFRDPLSERPDRGSGHDHQGKGIYLTSDPYGYGVFFARNATARHALSLMRAGDRAACDQMIDSDGVVLSVTLSPEARILALADASPEIRTLFADSVGDRAVAQALRDAVLASGHDGLIFPEPNAPEGWEVDPTASTLVLYRHDLAHVTGHYPPAHYRAPRGWSDRLLEVVTTEPGAPLFAPQLASGEAIAEMVASLSRYDVDTTMISELYEGCGAQLVRVSLSSLRAPDPDHNIEEAHRQAACDRLPLDTMPPLLIADGRIMDGGHRYRTLVKQGAESVLAYVVIDQDLLPRHAGATPDVLTLVDGAVRSRLDSQGKLIHPTEEGIRNFWRWFGDGCLTDVQGRPCRLYHGSRDNADIRGVVMARSEQGDEERGFYLTDSLEHADCYAAGCFEGDAVEGGVIYPLFVASRNPYRIDAKAWNLGECLTPEAAQAAGHDAVLIESHEGGTTVIVFDALCVKSALGNSGAFDPYSPSIADDRPSPRFQAEVCARERMAVDPACGADEAVAELAATGAPADDPRWQVLVDDWADAPVHFPAPAASE